MKLSPMAAFLAFLALLATSAGTALAQSPRVYHVPAVEESAGKSIEIVAEILGGWQAELEVRFRPMGAPAWQRAPFQRLDKGSYRATIPGDAVVPPGIEYYITSFSPSAQASEQLHFASAASPHPVHVSDDDQVLLEESELARFSNRRASFRAAGELVDFGSRVTEAGTRVRDRYYRVDVDFTYRLFRFPLRAFRLGFTQMLGDVPLTERGVEQCPASCEESAGFRAGGWTELRWRLTAFADFDSRLLIQATPDGFGLGARGELRFGDETASHFSLGAEGISEVGTNFYVRLGWGTVPQFPMAATVELTDYPSAHRDHGVRLVYDIAYEAGLGLRVGGRIGYQARDQNIGGVSGGLNATLDF